MPIILHGRIQQFFVRDKILYDTSNQKFKRICFVFQPYISQVIMKFTRKSLVSVFMLLCVICMIYFMSSSSSEGSLGKSSPINLSKNNDYYDFKNEQSNLKIQDSSSDEIDNPEVIRRPSKQSKQPKEKVQEDDIIPEASNGQFTETPFMPKMANETLKAQLGNAAWKLFHTILARYPEEPSKQEQTTLDQYIHLFAQVYPCGDCARHFQGLLAKYPPQIKSRKTAALWGCHIHNKVNERLEKPEYDCTTILEDYDCGCGSDEKEDDKTLGNENIEHLRSIKVNEKEESPQLGG